ncbi:prolipoprotein diacylglyceryl transferase [Lederbergia lenta]|uniref:hypothetical protein n=1 Tax=Lederbergia lenta TaxID=1467 RepID=UPI0008267B29|nr:hypothetical protein [Lederbergia lenta]MCM3111934.1 hypothetical protein [Lederbergia lenta]MEC2323102.1 hypothetical protein [Lederbergia lenta]
MEVILLREKKGTIAMLLTSVLVITFIVGGYIYWEKHLLGKASHSGSVSDRNVENHKGKNLSAALLFNKQVPELNEDDEDEEEEIEENVEEDLDEINESMEESVVDHYSEQSGTNEVYNRNPIYRNNDQSTTTWSNNSNGQASTNKNTNKTPEKNSQSKNSSNTTKPAAPPKKPSEPEKPNNDKKPETDSEEPKETPNIPVTPVEPKPDQETPKEPEVPEYEEDVGGTTDPEVPEDLGEQSKVLLPK